MTERLFGVEIECGHPQGYPYVSDFLKRQGFLNWNVGSDGSGVEARSPKLKGKDGFSELREVMDAIRGDGGFVTTSDGMHTHHDAPEFIDNWPNITKLALSWFNNQASINKMVTPLRRNFGACAQLTAADLDLLKTKHYLGGRKSLNFNSLRRHGTVEIRLHEGTLDPERAIAWVRFGQEFIEGVLKRKRPIVCIDEQEALLDRLKVPAEHKPKLLAPERKYPEYREVVEGANHNPAAY